MKYRREFSGEFGGTFLMVFFGVGSVQAAVLTGAQAGIWQVAVVWGVAVALGIYVFGAASGAHLNPAITVAMAVLRGFDRRKMGVYILAQFLGATAAAAILYLQFRGALIHYEASLGIVRGEAGSQLSAMVFGEYFPHPGLQRDLGWAPGVVGLPLAMLAEFMGTAFLAAVVFALTDKDNRGGAGRALTPAFIGLTVAIIISVLSPMTQAGLNPARDFGPRVVAFLAGWGPVAIPGPSGGFFSVYILSPCLGAVTGGYLYRALTRYDLLGGVKMADIGSGRKELTKVAIVGGFLGAGKSTLLSRARQELQAKGMKVGIITNDQAPGLVDTVFLGGGGQVQEVAGSCFCCNFPAFEKALACLADWGASVVLAEPVGSCTDLSATILQPLKDLHRERYAPSPFTVLLDPERCKEILGWRKSGAQPDAFYILGRQLAEADCIALTKGDLIAAGDRQGLLEGLAAAFPSARVECLSAKTGEGVSAWLEGTLLGAAGGGQRLAEVDYDRYADGEAALGWLNLKADLGFESRGGPVQLAAFLERLRLEMENRNIQIGHVKALWPSPEGLFMGNLIDFRRPAVITSLGKSSPEGPILVNARAESEPAVLEGLVKEALREIGEGCRATVAFREIHSLVPGRPQPTHRYQTVITA